MGNEGIWTHPITPLTIHVTRTSYVIIRACFCQENKDKISYLVYLGVTAESSETVDVEVCPGVTGLLPSR